MDTGEGGGYGGVQNYSSGDGHGDSTRGYNGDGSAHSGIGVHAVGYEIPCVGNGWGNGWQGTIRGGGIGYDIDVDKEYDLVRSDPVPDDLRQLITNVVAFKHIFK